MRYIVFSSVIVLSLLIGWIVSSTLSSTLNNSELQTTVIVQPTGSTDTIVATKSKPISKVLTNSINLDTLLWTAKKYIGTPYKRGGTSFNGLDCSGLIQTVFKEMGYKLPHNASELSKHGILISKTDQLIEGDLLFFHTRADSTILINHTGLYLGKGYFIHATTSLGTIISNIKSPIYKSEFICATRILLPQPSINLASRSRIMALKNF